VAETVINADKHGFDFADADRSPTFPAVSKDDLYQFLTASQVDEVAAEITFRTWLRTQGSEPE
jgi:hypothetical protein